MLAPNSTAPGPVGNPENVPPAWRPPPSPPPPQLPASTVGRPTRFGRTSFPPVTVRAGRLHVSEQRRARGEGWRPAKNRIDIPGRERARSTRNDRACVPPRPRTVASPAWSSPLCDCCSNASAGSCSCTPSTMGADLRLASFPSGRGAPATLGALGARSWHLGPPCCEGRSFGPTVEPASRPLRGSDCAKLRRHHRAGAPPTPPRLAAERTTFRLKSGCMQLSITAQALTLHFEGSQEVSLRIATARSRQSTPLVPPAGAGPVPRAPLLTRASHSICCNTGATHQASSLHHHRYPRHPRWFVSCPLA